MNAFAKQYLVPTGHIVFYKSTFRAIYINIEKMKSKNRMKYQAEWYVLEGTLWIDAPINSSMKTEKIRAIIIMMINVNTIPFFIF